MDTENRRRLREELPLPLAQLYSRAYNDKEARSRHNNAYYLIEALIRLCVAVLIAAYREELKSGQSREPQLIQFLKNLRLPSAGHWLRMLHELASYFGNRIDAPSHPLAHLWEQLTGRHRDRPAMLALYNEIVNGVDGEPGGHKSCSVMELFEALIGYRNQVMGHGAERWLDFYERRMGPQLLPAVNELLRNAIFTPLGPSGTCLVYVTEIRMVGEAEYELSMRELIGMASERLGPVKMVDDSPEKPAPESVGVLWPGRRSPISLDPLLRFQEREIGEEVIFLNSSQRGAQKAEYLSYTAGHTFRHAEGARAVNDLLSLLTGDSREAAEAGSTDEQAAEETKTKTAETGAGERYVGDYELLGEIGRGGMGVVYLARQVSLERFVALKMLPNDLQGDEVAHRRLRRDIRALARCEHPNIVTLLDADTSPEGSLYYTMEYVPGCDLEAVSREVKKVAPEGTVTEIGGSTLTEVVRSLSRQRREKLKSRVESQFSGLEKEQEKGLLFADRFDGALPSYSTTPLPDETRKSYIQKICELIRDAARALETVHKQGIVHRDVSPGNLMVTPDGNRIVLMDFGLAKGTHSSGGGLTKEGFVGKLRYAAPEQLATAVFEIGPAADVRGLGVTLWELLTRRYLFEEARDERQLATKVHAEDVPRLRRVHAGFDPDLEAIVARATERNSERRIQSAGELADYLDRYLAGEPLPIRPPSRLELTGRWARENKSTVASVASLAVAMAIAFATVGGFWNSSPQSKHYRDLVRVSYDLALKATAQRSAEDLKFVREKLKKVIHKGPESSGSYQSYLGLAETDILLGYYGILGPKKAYGEALTNARKAVDLKECAKTLNCLAYVQFAYKWDWASARVNFEEALKADSSFARAHHWYGWYLAAMGEHGAAIGQLGEAKEDRKDFPILCVDKGWCHYYAGEFKAAEDEFNEALDISPNFPLAKVGLGQTFRIQGKPQKAINRLQEAVRHSEGPKGLDASAFMLARLGHAYGHAGKFEKARKIRQQLTAEREKGDYIASAHFALIDLGLGNHGQAIKNLERALKNKSEYVTTLAVDPIYSPLHDNPKFRALLKQLQLIKAFEKDRQYEAKAVARATKG